MVISGVVHAIDRAFQLLSIGEASHGLRGQDKTYGQQQVPITSGPFVTAVSR